MSSLTQESVESERRRNGIRRKPVQPDYGRRLLLTVSDERAQDDHKRPYASIPNSNNARDGFRDITYRTFANAINRCAIWLQDEIGVSTTFEAIVYIGPADLRYQILCMAAVETGHVMFFASPQITMEAFQSLLKEAAASKLIAPSDALPIVSTILKERPVMQRLVIPELSVLLDERPVKNVPELYRNFESGEQPSHAQLDLHNVEAAGASLGEHLVSEQDLKHIGWSEDFFGVGTDSIETTSPEHEVKTSLPDRNIEPKQVYGNPSIDKLAASLQAPVAPIRDNYTDLEIWTQMQQIFWDVTSDLPHQSRATAATMALECDLSSEYPSNEEKALQFNGASPSASKNGMCSWARMLVPFGPTSKNLTQQPYVAADDEDLLISMMPPDGGMTAWLQVLASFLINLNNWGLVNSFGVFQAYYETDLLSSHSAATIAWIGTIQAALLLIVGVFSGPLFDKGYFRVILVGAGITIVFALMMLSLATEYYQVMLSQGLLVGLCCGLLYVPSVALMPLYFKNRRGLALGLATSGASIGGVIYPIAFRRLLNELGFPWAVRIIGFVALVTLTAAATITRPLQGMTKPVRQLFEVSAVKELPFLTFVIHAFLLFCGFLVPFFLTPTYAATALQTSENTAFYLVAVINAAQFFGRTVPAFLSDQFGGEIMMFSAEVVSGMLGLCWIAVHDLGGFTVFLIIYGFASGVQATLPAVVIPYLCPSLAVIGTRMGMVYAAAGVGALVSVPVATAAAADTGGFLGAQLWMGLSILMASAFYLPGGIAAWRQRRAMARPFGWKGKSTES